MQSGESRLLARINNGLFLCSIFIYFRYIRRLPFPITFNPFIGRFAVVFLAKQGNGFRLFLFLIDQKHYRYEKRISIWHKLRAFVPYW